MKLASIVSEPRTVVAGMSTTEWFGLGLMMALALFIGIAGMNTLPPDDHEVLVLRTTQEMHARGDWILPYFNGQPRLNKPPMSYWLTGLTARLAGADGAVAPWHGRVPSLLGGLGMLALIIVIGGRLFPPRAARTRAARFVTAAGFYTYSHHARPDQQYAIFCSARLKSGALAQLGRTRRPELAVHAMWVAYALAILTKGPQVPAMLLLGTFVYHRQAGTPWRSFASPGALLLALALVLPWWVALRMALASEVLEHSQLAGTLLRPSFAHLLNGYYLYRPLQLLLPWLPLVPIAWVMAWRAGHPQSRSAARYLVFACVALVVGFSFGTQQRYFYLLPAMLPLCLLAGVGIDSALDRRSWQGLLPWFLQTAVLVAALAWLFLDFNAVWLLGPVLTLAGAIGFFAGAREDLRPTGLFAACVVMAALVYVMPPTAAQLWSDDRRNKVVLADEAAGLLGPQDTLVSLRLTPGVYVYRIGRQIPLVRESARLADLLRALPAHEIYVLTETRLAAELAPQFVFEPLALMPARAGDRAGLYRLTLPGN